MAPDGGGRVTGPGDVSLTTRLDIVAAAEELSPDGHHARLIEHEQFVVALLPQRVAVFEFEDLLIVRRWASGIRRRDESTPSP